MSDTKRQMIDYIFNRVVLILPEYHTNVNKTDKTNQIFNSNNYCETVPCCSEIFLHRSCN